MDRYPPIAEHGLIGDLQTAALVTTDGSVDWFCCPRFDSPSVFGSLLDRERGGHFRIAAEGDDVVVRQLYFPDTAILVTRFMTPGGVGEVLDFMPVEDPQQATDRHRLVRVVRCVRGSSGSCSSVRPGSTTADRNTSWSSPIRGRSSTPRRCS
jgi:GH15 family glucan-1,4-alpha-glucosidase